MTPAIVLPRFDELYFHHHVDLRAMRTEKEKETSVFKKEVEEDDKSPRDPLERRALPRNFA